jgi:hypothetical protein
MLNSNVQFASWILEAKIILMTISSIGTPIFLVYTTSSKILGHFAWVLVDVDMSQVVKNRFFVEHEWYALFICLFIFIDCEKLPMFCESCKVVGYSQDKCKKIHSWWPCTKVKTFWRCCSDKENMVTKYIFKNIIVPPPL